ncbi:MAG: ATP-binding cassette domain-containing protein [Chloroflexi bacterium]|nr:ATP-binding cassette domain-containing protein [Chloroflexota bacterium]
MPETGVIVCENLSYIYPNGVQALCDINISINRGDYIAFVGQNGSGKTTLVKHFNGLLKPTRGSIRVFGEETRDKKVSALSRKVGYVFQNPDDMLFCSSVEEEIAYGPKLLGFEEVEIKENVEKILHELGLAAQREAHPFTLSLGDRQRLAVACVLSLSPEIFVFDEPTTGQDYFGGKSIMSLIDQLHAKGKTIVIITHDMPLVAEHARRVVVMNQGQIALDGTPGDVFSQIEQLRRLSLRSPQVTLLAQNLGSKDQTILNVGQMYAWLETEYLVSPRAAIGDFI